MQLKTEEHEKQITEFTNQFVNRNLTLHDSRLITAVFDIGRLLTDSKEMNKDFYLSSSLNYEVLFRIAKKKQMQHKTQVFYEQPCEVNSFSKITLPEWKITIFPLIGPFILSVKLTLAIPITFIGRGFLSLIRMSLSSFSEFT